MTDPPLIAVSGCRKDIGGQDFDCAGRKYTLALEQACDAIPLIVPTAGGRLDRAALLRRVDGILFTGSPSNIEPHHYDGTPSLEGTHHDPDRDATTLPLLREAVAAGVPVFCICRGFQEMNVAYGGTLHQRVHELPGMIDHREDPELDLDARYAPVHDVTLNPDGAFKAFCGFDTAMVNSLHEQAIDTLPPPLQWEVKAPDGVIEGISVRDSATFAAAVQWHPEWKVMENPFYLALFREFAAACRQRMDKPRR